MSLDAILNRLEVEDFTVPSRGTVQNIVHQWSELPGDIRQRDLPFEWHQLERAGIPWEASRIVLDCLLSYERYVIRSAQAIETKPIEGYSVAQFLRYKPVFTNRWATWCWKVSQALPDWAPNRVVIVAATYAMAEQARDLLPDQPSMEVAGYDAWLTFRPYQAEKEYWTEGISNDAAIEYGTFYLNAVGLKIAPPIPAPDGGVQESDMDLPITTPSDAAKAMWMAKERDELLTAWWKEYEAWDWESHGPQGREE